MKPSAKKNERRTFSEIALLSINEVTAALVAAGIRPIEDFLIDDRAFLLHEMPKLEQHQRWNWMEYAPRSSDPFVLDHYTRNPQDDLPTTWRKQLFESDLKTYVESLSRPQLMAQLKVVHVDEHFDRTPEPGWTADQYRTELSSRITELETAKPTTTKQRRRNT